MSEVEFRATQTAFPNPEGYVPPESRQHSRTETVQRVGRSYCYITCPFCNVEVKAFIWSLCGGGKKCPCGAMHGGYGQTYAPQPKKKRTRKPKAVAND